ncbi:MAG TPA: ATP-dependent DNA helicase [Acidimicrobiia bacterium]
MTESRIGVDDWPAAIEETEGRQLVVAGPGTGKTEFLARRVAHLVQSEKARRDEIAVLCFSRRAAGHLTRRIEELVGSTGHPITVTTFHSLALSLIEAARQGEPPTVLTTPEQVDFAARTLVDEDPADWPLTFRGILTTRPFAVEVADFVMRCSERLLGPDDLEEMARERSDWRGLPGFYRRYLQRLRAAGRTDYGVLLADVVDLLSNGHETPYRYVLVDEYQDTTPAQAEMARLLAAPGGNLTVAGDPYQSIYSFRGAELSNIAEFEDARRMVLAESFRVPKEIMEAALRVVAGADLPGAAGPVVPAPHRGSAEAYVFDQETAEAEWIAEQVERAIVVERIPPGAIAILVRTKKELAAELSRALERRGIPHEPPKSRLVDHPAVSLVRDIVTVAVHGGSLPTTDAVDAAEADRAMRRILLGPVIGLDLATERALVRARRRTWEPWHSVVAERLPHLPGLASLLSDPDWATKRPAADGFWHLWTNLEGLDGIVADPERADWRRAWRSFSQTLARQSERDPSVSLERYFALTEDEDFEAQPMLPAHLPSERVTLTTLHQAKGLEFEVVFIANAIEGVFPDLRRGRRLLRPELLARSRLTDVEAQGAFQLQEEVRLAYTAMTRARTRVVWTATHAGGDLGERRPSRFLIAAAGRPLDELGPPDETEAAPVTVAGVERTLRRWLLDPDASAAQRLGAVTVLAGHAGDRWNPMRFAGVPAPGPSSPILTGSFRLSPSQAESYLQCPRRYAMERRLRLAETDSGYAASGSLIHLTVERAENEIIGTGATHASLDRAMQILDEVWAEHADFGNAVMNDAWLRRAREPLAKLYTFWPSEGVPVAMEKDVETEIGGVRWRGVIDRLEMTNEGLRVVDLKTSRSAPPQADAARSIQLAFYVIALRDAGQQVVDAQLWYPATDAKKPSVRYLDVSAVDDLRAEMEAIVEGIRSENWEPRISAKACKYCPFKGTCPQWPEGRDAYLP